MDVRNLEGTDTMRALFDYSFVPASCAMLNVSAMKTGVLWSKCYTSSFLAMSCAFTFVYCTRNSKQAPHMGEFRGYTAEVYNEVNCATSNENANHLEQYLDTHPL